jgi:hypothetical protein
MGILNPQDWFDLPEEAQAFQTEYYMKKFGVK